MGRRSSKRPWSAPHQEFDPVRIGVIRHTQTGPGGADYQVQTVRSSAKSYTCPGCHQSILPGTPHIVAWPEEAAWGLEIGPDARRHWHTHCWQRGIVAR